MKINISELKTLLEEALTSKYYSQDEAALITEVYMWAEIVGKNTQGVLKFLGTEPVQNIKPAYKPKITKETKLSILVDGGGSAGPLIAQITSDLLIAKAKENGLAVAGFNNNFSSTGAIGFYCRKFAQNNLIGIVCSNSPRTVSYENVIEPLFGTNPIAFGFPTKTNPIVFDMASSAITWYGLVRAKALGQKIPNNVAIDKEGNITQDPSEAMSGAILPFDNSYKSAGLALIVELLAGSLTGADTVFDEGQWGTFMIAIDPETLVGLENFKNSASSIIEKIKQARRKDNSKSVHIPGYDSEDSYNLVTQSGEIEIEDNIYQQLLKELKE